jgi:hypothetical protein
MIALLKIRRNSFKIEKKIHYKEKTQTLKYIEIKQNLVKIQSNTIRI